MTPEQQAAADAANAASTQAQQLGSNEPTPEAPQPEPAPVEPAQVPEPAQQAPVDPDAPVSTPEPVPAPVAPVEPEPEDDYAYDPIPTFNIPAPQAPVVQQQPQQPAPLTVAPLNPADFTDQYGNVDMAKFTNAIAQRDAQLTQTVVQNVMREVQSTILPQAEARSAQQLMAVRSEERQWKAAETAYPELATNKELRDLVHNTRLNYTVQGAKQLTPKAAADKLFKYIGQARDEATQAATETVRYQAASTHVETANNTVPQEQLQRDQTRSRIASKDRVEARDARHSLLKQMMSDGSLKLPE